MIQFTDEQMRKLIKEETEKFLNSPYDESFDLVLEDAAGFDSSRYTNPMAQAAAKARRASLPRADRLAQQRADDEKVKAKAAKAKAAKGAAAPAAATGGGGGAGGSTTTSQASPDEPKPNTQQQAVATTEPNAAAPAAAKQTWGDKLKQAAGTAAGAAKKGFDKFRASDINQKGGEAILDLGKRTASGIAKAGIGTAGAIGKGVGAAAGDALGGTVKGLAKGVKGAIDMFRATPLQKMAKNAKKAGLGAAEIAKLHQAHQVGALSEKQIATLKLMERCLKSRKVKIIKEDKDPIIIDV